MIRNSPNPSDHYLQLDGLRCFAVISVMIGHWIAWDTSSYFIKNIPWSHGVILFFVLSGYLISNILFSLKEKIEAKKMNLKKALGIFYIRRTLRIFPAYYFLIFYLYYINHGNTRQIFPWLLTYTSNFLQCQEGAVLGDFTHFWSLAIEEQFYIFWPFIIFLIPNKHLVKTILLFLIVSLVSRSLCYLLTTNWMLTAYFTPNLFFPLCLGALLAYAARHDTWLNGFFGSRIFLCVFVALYIAFYYFHKFIYKANFMNAVLDEYVFSLACAFIIYRASKNGFKGIVALALSNTVVVYVGKISYGLYLYHLFVIGLYWKYLNPRLDLHTYDKNSLWFVYFCIIFLLATVSYYVLEKPFNSLKKYFKY